MRRTAKHRFIGIGIALLLLFAINGLVIISQFIGYASFDSTAGTITELIIQHEINAENWAGVFGVAVRVDGFTNQQFEDLLPLTMEEKNLLFNCLEKSIEHEVYVTTVDPLTLDISSLSAATAAEVDASIGKSVTDFDSATNTYTTSTSWSYGASVITAPSTVTYKIGEDPPTTFRNAIAKTADGTLVYVALVTNFTDGFNGRLYNYQILLPLLNTTTRFYFWTDPNDLCPEGDEGDISFGTVFGTVTTTSGTPVEAVIVDVAGVTNLTNAAGQYTIRTRIGSHNIFAIKTGYQVYHNNVTVIEGNSTQHDIVLAEEVVANPNTDSGADDPGDQTESDTDVGPGEDTGPGEAPLIPIVEQRPRVIEGQDYIISLVELNRKLRIGQFLQERILVYSFKKSSINIKLSINNSNLTKLFKVDNDDIIIEPNDKGEFILTIFGVPPEGIFNGTIDLSG